MNSHTRSLACLLLLLPSTGSLLAQDALESPPSCYLIGNSLTWDTIPSRLDGDVQWHVDCGKSLPFMHAHPEKPCVKNSTLWPTALKEKQYDYLVVQPHYGSTLAEDVEVISKWLAMQPEAVLVIHTGWARHATQQDEYAKTHASGPMQHSPAYISALVAALQEKHAGREIRQTHAMDLLARVADDVAADRAPFAGVADLYRDAIHMKHDTGKYLMHNAMRRALGQKPSAAGFDGLDAATKKYLDQALVAVE